MAVTVTAQSFWGIVVGKEMQMKKKIQKLLAFMPVLCMAAGLLLTGCAGPSTRVIPRENHRGYFESREESPLLEEANPFYIQEVMGVLTASHRPSGSKGEMETARMLQQFLTDYGYDVTRQRFRLWDGNDSNEVTGTNVIAVREAYSEDADILIISTHHDTVENSPGANHNASGVVTWLETARLVSRLPSDTEVRFVSFSGFEDGWLGSRYYVESLPQKDKERVIGAIQLDAYGSLDFPELVLGTSDGGETMLGDMIRQSFWAVTGEALQYEIRDDSDAVSFVNGQIPAVCLTQKRDAYAMNTPLDLEETIDIERIARVTDCIADMVAKIMKSDSPSMRAKSHFMNDLRDSAYVQRKAHLLGFGTERERLEAEMRQEGLLISSHEDGESQIEGYQYQMKWFDVDQIILSNYYFADGRLESVTLDADGAGVDLDDMMERLESWYGKPDQEEQGPNGMDYTWKEPVLGLLVKLTQIADGYDVEMWEYRTDPVILGQFQMDGKLLVSETGHEVRNQKAFNKLEKMIPDALRDKIGRILFYSDGVGATRGYIVPVEDENGFLTADIFLDLDDLMTTDAKWRNETAAEKQMLQLAGEIQILDGTGATAENFYEKFPEAEDSQEVQTDIRPGEAEGEGTSLPGFAESFMYFVLTGPPDDRPGEWSERIGFFYDRSDLVAWRKEIRENLGLQY